VFNTRKAPFDDPKVRMAFAMAINREQLIDVVYKDMVVSANTILPQAFPGYNPGLPAVAYDPAQAKQLIAESSYANNMPDIVWSTIGGGGAAGADTQAIAEMLKENLGVNISIEQTDYATYLAQINGLDVDFQMFDIGWSADYVDPHNFLGVLFAGEINGQPNYQNWAGYKNPEVDRILDAAAVETSLEKRIGDYQRAEEMILKDMPALPLFYGREYWLTKPYVKGAFYPPLVISRLKYISLEK
jgi:oligopeptide transport system substrate-binding protein